MHQKTICSTHITRAHSLKTNLHKSMIISFHSQGLLENDEAIHNSPGDRKFSTAAGGNPFANITHDFGKTHLHQPCLSTSKQIPQHFQHSSTSTDVFSNCLA
ncbi:unnamed protein product [Schistosoma margrebowiei]|uniref:Uncharacterized protein n=1 Tax=Schistosoma margrebowiei TaxID=48269 RepID=A0A183LBC3_9TREM|nr:unnamed protein product [Schistosoma margrebowiei]